MRRLELSFSMFFLQTCYAWRKLGVTGGDLIPRSDNVVVEMFFFVVVDIGASDLEIVEVFL